MARTKKEYTLSLENVLWNCRVALRGIGSTEKNRDAVIGLVFLKFAGDKFESRLFIVKDVTVVQKIVERKIERDGRNNLIIEPESKLYLGEKSNSI